MIWASMKMGWLDKRLLLPSVLAVFINIMFGTSFVMLGLQKFHPGQSQATPPAIQSDFQRMMAQQGGQMPTHGLLGKTGDSMARIANFTQPNGPSDPNGFGETGAGSIFSSQNAVLLTAVWMTWWLTNLFFQGVTTGLVYSHLTEGKGSGSFSEACKAVFSSLPAIVMLGAATFVAKWLAGWLRNKQNTGVLGMGFNFLAGVVEVFWTLAGHLILPAIVIEGTSFWGGLKRADKIAQGNLLTIGIGEVGVDVLCKILTRGVYLLGVSGFGMFAASATGKLPVVLPPTLIIPFALCWIALVVVVTSLSKYLTAAFYTCLYVYAIEVEAVEETERTRVKLP